MLHLSEEEVTGLLTMPDALRQVEAALRDLGNGRAENRPRQRVRGPHAVLNVMPASWPGRGYYGFKYYSISRQGVHFWFHLFDGTTGELLAILEANRLGQQRTGAASGIATKLMARKDATTVGVVGTGWQAESQLEAICAVRPVSRIRCFSRHEGPRKAFAARMGKEFGVDVVPAGAAEQAVRGADIVVAATTSTDPVVRGEWLAPGAHLNAMGGNRGEARELDDATIRRCTFIAVDSVEQARTESGDLTIPVSQGILSWVRVAEFPHVVAGKVASRRTPEDITLFKSLGLAIEDVAVGALVYERAKKARVGTEVSI